MRMSGRSTQRPSRRRRAPACTPASSAARPTQSPGCSRPDFGPCFGLDTPNAAPGGAEFCSTAAMRTILSALLLALAGGPALAAECMPIEKREPNAPEQRPAFIGQTRACEAPSEAAFDVVVLAKGLENPWAVEPLPDGRLLVSEKRGRLRIVSAKGKVGAPIRGLPKVDARSQGGLLDVALSPSFGRDRTLFWSYAEPRKGGNGTAVARGVLSEDGSALQDVRVIFRVMP